MPRCQGDYPEDALLRSSDSAGIRFMDLRTHEYIEPELGERPVIVLEQHHILIISTQSPIAPCHGATLSLERQTRPFLKSKFG